MKLLEKFAALRLGDLRFGCAFRQRTKGIEGIKLRIADSGLRIAFASPRVFGQLNRCKAVAVQFGQKIRPRNKKRIIHGNLLRVFIGTGRKRSGSQNKKMASRGR